MRTKIVMFSGDEYFSSSKYSDIVHLIENATSGLFELETTEGLKAAINILRIEAIIKLM